MSHMICGNIRLGNMLPLISYVGQTLSLEIKGHRLELTLSDLTYLVPGGGVILIAV